MSTITTIIKTTSSKVFRRLGTAIYDIIIILVGIPLIIQSLASIRAAEGVKTNVANTTTRLDFL
jgi:hypothetical protein